MHGQLRLSPCVARKLSSAADGAVCPTCSLCHTNTMADLKARGHNLYPTLINFRRQMYNEPRPEPRAPPPSWVLEMLTFYSAQRIPGQDPPKPCCNTSEEKVKLLTAEPGARCRVKHQL